MGLGIGDSRGSGDIGDTLSGTGASILQKGKPSRRHVDYGVAPGQPDPESEARKAYLDRIGREAEKSAMQDAIAMAQALRGQQAVELANEADLPLPSAAPTSDGRNQRPPTSFPGAGQSPVPVDQNSAAPSQTAPVQ